MATQLTRRSFLSSLSDDKPVLRIPVHYMLAIAAASIAIVYTSLFAAIYNAGRDEAAAERLYADTLTLIEAPPSELEALKAELAAANASLKQAEALMEPSTIDAASDAATALLVRRAQASGVSVTGVARIDPSQMKSETATYDVQAIRITVDGSTGSIGDFLNQMHTADPAMIATLTSLEMHASGGAQADIVFSVYTAIDDATPVAGAAP
ncbi:MAG: hypothetical protein WEB52_08330 [Dehalococcoidia bacterium]